MKMKLSGFDEVPCHGRSLRGTSNVGYNTNKGNTDKDNHKNTGPSPSIITVTRFISRGTSVPDPDVISWWEMRKKTTSRSRNKTGAANQKINKYLFRLS
ncbi:hypothetical protein AgCh_007119 [Apium graveolens]